MGTTTCLFQQFNPSTLKALYNPVTEKAIVSKHTVSCEHCEDNLQPYAIKATLSNFVDVGCCDLGSGWEFEVAAKIMGTYRIPYTSPCTYSKVFSGDFGRHRTYLTLDNCEGIADGWKALNRLSIKLTITATGVDIQICIYQWVNSFMMGLFCASLTCDCDDISGYVDNNITGCIDTDHCYGPTVCGGYNSLHPCADTGRVTLEGLYC